MMEHYYSEKQTSKFEPAVIEVEIWGKRIELYTAGGVFSPKKVDRGTLLLIDSVVVGSGDRVLDLGCGYGVVGIAVVKKKSGVEIVLSDVNERALRLAKMNLRRNKVEGKVKKSDGFDKIEGKFDVVLFNPPQTAGKKICMKMIEDSREFLNEGGSLQLVARHQKGGKGFEEKMKEVFGNVEVLQKKGGFRVYMSKK
ncbi:class I SAM-dependent methyltransferase [Nanoarchaeota archaeon]